MSDLDDRLFTILTNDSYGILTEDKVAFIKQAFADAGYMYIKLRDLATNTFMAGQEWYDRYQTEKGFGSLDNLLDIPRSNDYKEALEVAVMKCDEAAKRSAGIET